MNHKNLTVCKANEVVEAGYKLTLNEQRVVLACIGQVNSTEELLKTDEFELSAKDFAVLFHVSEDGAYEELQKVAKHLYQRSLTIYNPNPSRPELKKIETRWISSIGYMPEKGRITLCFAPKLLPYLSKLKGQFTCYKLEHVGKMTSIYGIRLYELLAQWQGVGKREVEIGWLKEQFKIEDKYADMHNFKKRVIEPAVRDINKHSNFCVSWEQRKTGRRVTHFTFTFSEKASVAPSVRRKGKEASKEAVVLERTIFGVPESEIKAKARPGESWEGAASRIAKENGGGGEKVRKRGEGVSVVA